MHEYITKLSREKEAESEQLYKANQRHQVMADQVAAMNAQLKKKDEQILALMAKVATLTRSIDMLTTTIKCLPAMHSGDGGGES